MSKKPDGYWNNIENVIAEAHRFKKRNNTDTLPGAKKLQELGWGAMHAAICKYHGGMRKFRETIGEEQKELPKGAWKNEKFVVDEAKRFMHEHNLQRLPGVSTLSRMGYSSLGMAINSYHGGFRKFRETLGQPQVLRQQGLWKDKDYVLREARVIKKKHKFQKLPGAETLAKLGYSAFNNAVHKYHGGMNALRGILGEELPRTDSTRIRSRRYVLSVAREIMDENNFDALPGAETLYKLGYASFVNAINRHHGGIRTIRKSLGQEERKKKTGHWSEWGNVEKVLRKIIKKLGRFPTQRDLQKDGHASVAAALTSTHGGFNAARERLGFEVERVDNGYYTNQKNIDKTMREIRRERKEFKDVLPSSMWLQKNGYAALYQGIIKMHGTYAAFRKQQGFAEHVQVETGRWKDLEFTLQEAKRVIEKHDLESLPGTWTLNRLGYSSLGAAVQKYHGGFAAFRAKLNEYLGIESSSHKLEQLLETYAERNDE